MKTILTATATVLALAAPAFAQDEVAGDIKAGEKDWKKCKACHAIVAEDGTEILRGVEVRDLSARDIALFRARHPALSDQVLTELLPQGPWGEPSNTRSTINYPVVPRPAPSGK